MRETDYAYAVAYVRARENGMLTAADLEQLMTAENPERAMRLLAERGYGEGEALPPEQLSELLAGEEERAFRTVAEAAPKGAPVDVLLWQNDFHNAKTILKAVFAGVPWEGLMLRPSAVPPEEIFDAVQGGRIDALPQFLAGPVRECYELLARTGDGQRAEVRLDRAAAETMQRRAREEGEDFLLGYLDLTAALTDLRIASRAARSRRERALLEDALLPTAQLSTGTLLAAALEGEEAVLRAFEECGFPEAAEAARESVSALERWCDDRRLDYVRAAGRRSFGFAPLAGYLLGKQTELQAVRIILGGLAHGAQPAELRERVRTLYV